MNTDVLIVDDDFGVMFSARTILESKGYNVTTASNGVQCLDILTGGYRGIILLDVMMPQLDGWGTLREMKERHLTDGNVICMMTAVQEPGQGMEDVKDVVIHYLRKPFTVEALVESVQECEMLLA